MARIWFVSAPLFSHTDWGGFFKTAQVLQAQGHDVLWLSGEGLARVMQSAAMPFRALPETGWLWPPPPAPDLDTLPPNEAVKLRYKRALDTWLSEELVGAGAQALLDTADAIGPPDLIVTDPFLSASSLAAEKLDVPMAVCGWIAQDGLNDDMMFPVQLSLGRESQDRIARLKERFGVSGRYFADGPTPSVQSPLLHIAYFTRNWYLADADSLLPQNVFVGGAPTPPQGQAPQWLTDIPDETPLGLVTLGTTFTGDLGFFAWAARAAADVGLLPIVVIGYNPITPDDKAKLLRALPKGTRLLNFVPFDHVLPRVKLMFHHGGMGTTHAAVVHGIPQIITAHAADQRAQARRVAQAKVGLNLSAIDIQRNGLSEGARALLSDEAVVARARALADAMAALGGPPKAAEHLAALVDAAG